MGFQQTAKVLEEESGFVLESEEISAFRKGVLDGAWSLVESQLHQLWVQDSKNLKNIKFLLAKQKYLEFLERQDLKNALEILRNEIVTLGQGHQPELIHRLTSLMMCSSSEELREKAEWKGIGGGSRQVLLKEIQKHLSPSLMIPDKRLEALLLQAFEHQKSNCLHHNTLENCFSLFEDHYCDNNQIPRKVETLLDGHSDEVWHIKFSNNGRYLASGSKDCTAMIWDVGSKSTKPIHVFGDHEESVSFVCWSPDDTLLLTCARDKKLRLYNIQTGSLKKTISKHSDEVTACAWLPDSRRFVSASPDKFLHLWDIEGNLLKTWATPRVFDMTMNRMGTKIYLVCERQIHVYSIEAGEEEILQEGNIITSICISKDDKYALVNLGSQELHLWDLEHRRLIRKFIGHQQGNVVIRSCFGGVGEIFVASGSEDAGVYMWHRETGKLIEVLRGHKAIVNAVSWNPQNPFMFASASDDHTIRIWVVPPRSL